jgi:hypothetical protein
MRREIMAIRRMLRKAGPYPYLEESMLKASHSLGFAIDDLEEASREAEKAGITGMANRMDEIREALLEQKKGLDSNLGLASQWGPSGPMPEPWVERKRR